MFEKLKKQLKEQKGLTLVELLAVVVIIGIIAMVAIIAIGNIINNSKEEAIKSDAIQLINAANLYKATYGKLPVKTDSSKKGIEAYDQEFQNMVESGMEWTSGPTFGDTKSNKDVTTYISGTAVNDGRQVTFTDATIKDINNDNATNVVAGPQQ